MSSSEQLIDVINNIAKQFLCNRPIKNFVWNNIFQTLTYDSQQLLVRKTVNSNLVLKYQIETNYQKSFLKYIIENLEKHQDSEVHDELYSAYGRLVALPAATEYFKHYCIRNSGNIISIKENVNIISDGTTGLRTWQAALVLSEWALSNVEAFKNKTVLELGSGVGLTGLTVAMECSPKTVYLTDCHSLVLQTLSSNVKLNIDKDTTTDNDNDSIKTSEDFKPIQKKCVYRSSEKRKVFVLNLPWEEINKESCRELRTINTVIAADVVYDSELFDPLITALKCLAGVCSVDQFIFSCTERNKNTLEEFLERIRKAGFKIEELTVPPQENFMWPRDTPIRLCRFVMKQNNF
ncbi:hypothetical protein NQ315_010699 [Exocentrus adspersus]|uniref:FAM86 N-terminal domain-containing protein n=1 Tax=Exocentrus adspersus TaxID=1586481 RepID=A0AAV8VU89_9CUCU|nr:hypothetical protein NQ315_010699 [Exocentrus adspersus]